MASGGSNVRELFKMLKGFFTIPEVQTLDEDAVFTITWAGEMKVGQAEEEKPVLRFAETKKGLVLSKGRVSQLGVLFGATGSLLGKQIKLDTEVIAGKEQVVILSAAE
ncbi:MAG: hypothetical protein V3S83_12530 [Gemmatimonadota bacterium]